MQSYTCPTCGSQMERDLSIFMEHTDKHVVEEVKRLNPKWLTQDGFCPKCLEYVKKSIRGAEESGDTNIDAGEIRQRLLLGICGYAATIPVWMWLQDIQAPMTGRLIFFPLFFFGTLGFFQAQKKVCVVIAQKQSAAMKQKALNMILFALVVSAVLTAATFFISVPTST